MRTVFLRKFSKDLDKIVNLQEFCIGKTFTMCFRDVREPFNLLIIKQTLLYYRPSHTRISHPFSYSLDHNFIASLSLRIWPLAGSQCNALPVRNAMLPSCGRRVEA